MVSRVKVFVSLAILFSTFLIAPSAQATTTCASKSTNHGGYVYTAFKTVVSGCTWDVPIGISAVDMLIVAGGGGGGPRHSGGGGAGGVLKVSSVAMTNISTLAITVGAGGAGAYLSGSYVEATNGSNSSVAKSAGTGTLATQTAVGGGRGSQSSPSTGGSGGGTYSGSGAAGTAGQGNAGATGGSSSGWYGGGGGGAGGAGVAGSFAGGGRGGAGTTWVASFDTTTATLLKLTNLNPYFGGGGGGGITASSGPVSGGAGGVGGGGAGGGDGGYAALGPVGATGNDGIANTGGGGGGAGLKQITGIDSAGGAGGSGVVIFRYTVAETIQLSSHGAATSCIWGVGMNYAFLFNSGSGNAITKMRLQFETNALDAAFNATKIEIYTNNAGATGSLVGYLRPDAIAASSTAPGASVATRIGTYIGSTQVLSNTNYWFVVKNGGYALSMCQAAGSMGTQANSWSMVMNSGNFNMRVNGGYTTWPSVPSFEITTGTPDYLEPVVTGPSSSTGASASDSVVENSAYSFSYSANEYIDWSKSGNDAGLFSLTSSGGLSMTAKNFESASDANTNNIYEVTVTATDIGGNSTAQNLLLTVTNENEYPTFTSGGGLTHAVSVAENQSSVMTYTGSDPDTATTITWRIAGGLDSSFFTLNTSTGVLTFTSTPDFETKLDSNQNNVYEITIEISDGFNVDTQDLSVTITNINESAGIAAPTVSAQAYKGRAITVTVVADTPGKVQFYIDGKRIPNCLAVATTGSAPTATATCSFKPAVQGIHFITARINPSNNLMTATTSEKLLLSVGRRTTQR